MTMNEPKLELDAILEGKKSFQKLTIIRYALLDVVDSPFLNKGSFDMLSIIPSWYVMTADIKELSQYSTDSKDKIREAAYQKADEMEDFSEITKFTKDFVEYIQSLSKIAPDSSGDASVETKGKKAPTAS